MSDLVQKDLINQLNSAADWKDHKPFRDAELFRNAKDRIETLEAALREIIAKIPRSYLTTKPEEMAYRARCRDALAIARRALGEQT